MMSVPIMLVALGVVLFVVAAHPFGTYPISLALLARWRPMPIRGSLAGFVVRGEPAARRGNPSGISSPRVALCVCAYNEAAVIRDKAENMLAMRCSIPDLDLLIYVDASSDRTAEILADYAGRITVVVASERHGKTYGMNTLVAHTTAEFVVFSDANVMFAPDAIPALLAPFGDPTVGLTCGHLVYTMSQDGTPSDAARPSVRPVAPSSTARTGALYWRLEETIKRLESETGSVMGADGSIFAIRRALHRPPPADLIDDMFVSFMVLCQGYRLVRAADAVAYEETVSRAGEEFRRKVRIACQAFNVHRALRRSLRRLSLLDQYKYVSHKLLRWWTIYLLGASAFCIVAGLLLAQAVLPLLILEVIAAATAVVMARAEDGPAAALRSILEAFLATGIGCFRSLRGERFQTWSPPASARSAEQIPSVASGAVERVDLSLGALKPVAAGPVRAPEVVGG
jgi:cellulose synthase/poly-beta-1,6-N-acetylglucosamine synthase-like glycosyltransferase